MAIGLVVAALPITPLVALLLFYLVALLAVVMAVPYIAAFVGMVMRVVRRGETGDLLSARFDLDGSN